MTKNEERNKALDFGVSRFAGHLFRSSLISSRFVSSRQDFLTQRRKGAESYKEIADRLLCGFAPLREKLFWLRREPRWDLVIRA
jgi:hypothetical protein